VVDAGATAVFWFGEVVDGVLGRVLTDVSLFLSLRWSSAAGGGATASL
jgi:hypothetical protein